MSALIGLALLAAACTEEPKPPAKPAVDHQVAQVPPAPLGEGGPSATALSPVWEVTAERTANVPGGQLDVDHRIVGDQLVVASQRGVDVFDARTGEEAWHYYEKGRRLRTYAATDDALVLFTDDSGKRPRTVGLDAVTGELRWEREGSVDTSQDLVSGRAIAGAGVVLAAGKRGKVSGIDARTGKTKWERATDANCQVFGMSDVYDSDGSLLLVKDLCSKDGTRIAALDPETGRPQWTRLIPVGTSSDIFLEAIVRDQIVLLRTTQDKFVIMGPEGDELLGEDSDQTCPVKTCHLAVAADRAVIAHKGKSAKTQMTVLHIVTGATKPVTAPPGTEGYVALETAGTKVYGMRKYLAGSLLPAGFDVIDPVKRSRTQAPLPFAFQNQWTPGLGPPISAGRVLVADERLYVALQVDKFSSLRAYEPDKKGSFQGKSWPDACELGRGAKRVKPQAGRKPESIKIGKTTFKNVGCHLYLSASSESVKVSIAWVAGDVKMADELLEVVQPPAKAIEKLGDEAYRFPDQNVGPQMVMRVGTTIVVLDQQGPEAENLAKTIAKNLGKK